MGLSIIETDRLLICPYHLACAIPMAADREIEDPGMAIPGLWRIAEILFAIGRR